MSAWFAIPRVPGAVVGMPELEWVDLGFAVLPMGGSHSVFLAQEVHLEILRRVGLPMDRRLVDGEALLDAGAFFCRVTRRSGENLGPKRSLICSIGDVFGLFPKCPGYLARARARPALV